MRKKSINLLYEAAKTVNELESKSRIVRAISGLEPRTDDLNEARRHLHRLLELLRDDGYRSQKAA